MAVARTICRSARAPEQRQTGDECEYAEESQRCGEAVPGRGVARSGQVRAGYPRNRGEHRPGQRDPKGGPYGSC
jgi:hypothetical protein